MTPAFYLYGTFQNRQFHKAALQDNKLISVMKTVIFLKKAGDKIKWEGPTLSPAGMCQLMYEEFISSSF